MFYLVSLLVFAADRILKLVVSFNLMPSQSEPFIDGLIRFTYVRNTGMAFGFLQGQRIFLIMTGLLICAFIYYIYLKVPRSNLLFVISLALIMGGSLGNLFDRSFYGYVVDFIDLRAFPVFNFADTMINLGVIMIFLGLLMEGNHAPDTR